MTRPFVIKLLPLVMVLSVTALLYACAHTTSMAARHPVETEPSQMCSDCHTDWRSALNHSADFSTRHKYYAYQQQRACGLCHSQAYCSDCHAHKEEIKPSDKYKDIVTRDLPHRGDYLSQHQIDGRIHPATCAKCHGRQNNERCRLCHR
jgi:hypothetical protein